MNKVDQLYRDDLAQIHVDGYGFHWQGAAPSIIDWLTQYGVDSGRIVDLGCGGGQWLDCLSQQGYQTVGIDVSPAMIRYAKRNARRSKFICASFAEATIPSCDAVTSLGEPLNYLNSGPLMRQTIRNVFQALRPGGCFIFDVRHPPKTPVAPINHVKAEQDWFCYARIEENKNQLTRHITTFKKTGRNQFRRDEETHRLKLYGKQKMLAWLRGTGFRVKTGSSYGEYLLSERQSVFICRKPS